MSGYRVAMVAREVARAASQGRLLTRILPQSPLPCSFETVRAHLGADTDGLLLILVAAPADREPATRLIQEVQLRKLPPSMVVLVADKGLEASLAPLDPYVVQRLSWPGEASVLSAYRALCTSSREFTGTRPESLAELLRRRLLAQSPSLLPFVEHIALAASHDITVLLVGETGTGKSYLARLMHECSPRRDKRFLTVPCGALAANLVESELFGHVQGAFTGADYPKVGKFAAVGGGTLFLDEIDTLGLEQQVALLRVIETGEFEPVGTNETHHSQARLIVASNLDLEAEVQRGRFRQDLYYRLNVMSFPLPPLRERLQDIAPLVRSMVARFAEKFRKELFEIRADTLAALEAFCWPGNIRQLENVLQHAVLVSAGRELLPQHLPPALLEQTAWRKHTEHGSLHSLQHHRELMEHNLIQRVLADHGYSLAEAAQTLGISRVTLYKKMKKYGLPGRRGSSANPPSEPAGQPLSEGLGLAGLPGA